jgi:hypothetical protein
MFCVVHPNHVPIGKGDTIQDAIDNWSSLSHIDVDDELFDEFIFLEGKEVKVKREISYKVVKDEKI